MMINVAPSGMPNGDIRAMIKKKRGRFEDKSILMFPVPPTGGSIPQPPVCS